MRSHGIRRRVGRLLGTTALGLTLALSGGAAPALTLREAVGITIESNPQIGQAIENREAIEFELRQARGLYLPRVDFQASAGARRLDRPIGQLTALERREDSFAPAEAGLTVTWRLFDGYFRDAEVERQASRVDGASFRVLERSEFLALEVAREYFEIILQERIVRLADQNLGFLEGILGRIRENVQSGSLTEADLQQGEERIFAARARTIEARQDLAAARIRFLQLVGKNLTKPVNPPAMAARLPRSVDTALGLAVQGNPRLKIANADIDAAHALVKQARSRNLPEFFLEGNARVGHDIDGVENRTNDVLGRGVMRWNLYNGGIDQANIQEQTRRVAESQFFRDQVLREIREAVRLSFDRRIRQLELTDALGEQVAAATRVVNAYNEQFQVGRRSLLDVLDAQNTRYNGQVLLETSRIGARFAEYRIMAATGQLVAALGLTPPSQAEAYARARADVPPRAEAETLPRYSPSRGKPWLPEGAIQ
ncbi:TolC family outer membrane protein [Microvirga massiliensis]|uniref:TolC family outer membrane protein n=1 Tax=Microvirga massiliensis TaxID=1033741 RepID=UPI00062BCE34|nr:TolC family outer membrane protein [Microvirga massiliensis]